jgi:translation initiation factor 5B
LTVDSIIYDGVLRTNDEIALMTSSNEVLTTKIRSILRPLPLEEMRDSKKEIPKIR